MIAGPGVPTQAGPATARKARILVVEDEPTVLQLIADVLREEGYLVDTVLDSRQGLELARAHHYDLVDLRLANAASGRARLLPANCARGKTRCSTG